MGSYSISLDETKEKKLAVLRDANKRYKGMSNRDVINAILNECLDPIILKED